MAKSQWSDENYVRTYVLARSGFSDAKIAEGLGITRQHFREWKKRRPALKKAIAEARDVLHDNGNATFREYVFQRLPPDLKDLWERINECEEQTNGILRIEALLKNAGKRARQHLFLYALTAGAFNASEACRSVNITFTTMREWMTSDPDFASLMDEIHWHKENFYDAALVRLVQGGDSGATIFANRTFNRKRYPEKTTVELNGSITHEHVVSIADLDLPLEVRKLILQAVRSHKSQELLEHQTVDGQVL